MHAIWLALCQKLKSVEQLNKLIKEIVRVSKSASKQGQTGHITRWEKSLGAPLVRGPF
jgi:hypothetical protein